MVVHPKSDKVSYEQLILWRFKQMNKTSILYLLPQGTTGFLQL